MNEKDKALALEISEAFFSNRLPIINGKACASVHSNPTYNLADKIGAALTTVRQEARAAAFRDAAKISRETWVLVPAESENRALETERWKGFNQAAKEVAAKLDAAASPVPVDATNA